MPVPLNAADRLCSFVFTKSVNEPLARRAQLYRDLAEILATEPMAKQLRELAGEIEDFEKRAGQIQLSLELERDGGAKS